MMAFGFMQILLLLVTASGGNDLLDYIPTKSYWELKGISQPTVAAMAAELEKAKADEKLPPAAAVRRLMAIRWLGESKDAQAAAALQPLAKSERLFEADYAQQALAALDRKPFARPGAKDLAKDPWLLPAGCSLAAQVLMAPGKPVDVEKAMKDLAKIPIGGNATPGALAEVTKMLVSVADAAGNLRLNAVTIGLSGTVGPDNGFAVLIARGLYDAQAAKEALLKTAGMKATALPAGGEVLQADEHMALMLPSNDCLIMVAGARGAELPIESMLAALKQGKGELAPDSDLGKLIKSLDTTQPAWAAVKMSPTYQAATPMFAAFEAVTVVGRIEGDAQKLTLEAVGPDAQKVAAAAAEFDKVMAEARKGLEQAVAELPAAKPLADLLASIQTKTDGGKATVTATLKGAVPAMMLPMFFMARSAPAVHRNGPAPKEGDF